VAHRRIGFSINSWPRRFLRFFAPLTTLGAGPPCPLGSTETPGGAPAGEPALHDPGQGRIAHRANTGPVAGNGPCAMGGCLNLCPALAAHAPGLAAFGLRPSPTGASAATGQMEELGHAPPALRGSGPVSPAGHQLFCQQATAAIWWMPPRGETGWQCRSFWRQGPVGWPARQRAARILRRQLWQECSLPNHPKLMPLPAKRESALAEHLAPLR